MGGFTRPSLTILPRARRPAQNSLPFPITHLTLVQPEEMREFVPDRLMDHAAQMRETLGGLFMGPLEDANAVGQGHGSGGRTFGQWGAFVEAEQAGFGGVAHDDDRYVA